MSLIITGVLDGPLPGGTPKVIELYASAAIADLSAFALGTASNGGASDGPEFTLSGSAAAGQYLYVTTGDSVSGDNAFRTYLGIDADFTSTVASFNGDDAIELFQGGVLIDSFGVVGTDGTGEPWKCLDGWAARIPGSAASPVFDPAQWTFSGPDALDDAITNASSGAPFPIGMFAGGGEPPARTVVINEIDADQDGTDMAEFVELYDGGAGGTSLDGLSLVLFNGGLAGDPEYRTVSLDGQVTDADGYFVVGSALVENVDLVAWTSNGLQNGADAVALYEGAPPEAPTTEGLVDAVVYGTNDAPDTALLAALGLSAQADESGGEGGSTADSLQRVPNGAGEFAALAPTPGTANGVTPPPPPPPAEVTLISAIQGTNGTAPGSVIGTDDVSALDGETVTVRAIVTLDSQRFGGNGGLRGFTMQEEDADADGDARTSEGIFVFDGIDPAVDVSVGDLVEVTGTVGETFGQTQITSTMVSIIASGQPLPLPAEIDFPTASVTLTAGGAYVANLEAYEGMRVSIGEEMTVSELFQLGRFGQYTVTEGGQPLQFTQDNAPSVAGLDDHRRDVASRSVVVDDGLSASNPEVIPIIDGNDGVLTADDSFRMGDGIEDITGVLTYGFDAYRVQQATGTYVGGNPRPEAPEETGGNFKVASLNVLNYFTTIDAGDALIDNGQEPRGANSVEELERQAAKLVLAIVGMDADVVGLIEIENDFAGETFALADLVERVNAELGSEVYAYVDPGVASVGGDAISNALIYKRGEVNLVGEAAILTEFEGRDFVDPLGAGGGLNRPAIAQTFEDADTGETITVAVNHLKSKGSLSGLAADEAQGDGQGNNNATRTEAARILADWLASDPTGQGAQNTLIVGDLNAYAREDPLTVLDQAGYTDLAQAFIGQDASSYVFDGQRGTLDYALANDAALEDVVGVTEWAVNSPEALVLDYDLGFGRDPDLFDGSSPLRNSDHDPVIVSFEFETVYNLIAGTAGRDVLRGTSGRDRIEAGDGNDFVSGGGGNDLIDAGGGRDTVFAGAGDDRILIGAGPYDSVFGGSGADTFVMVDPASDGSRRDKTVIWDFDAEVDALDLAGAEIEAVRERFGSVTIDLADGGDRIVLVGVRAFDDVEILGEGGGLFF